MSTQKAFASYQEVIDLHTESDKVSVIGIHTPVDDTPWKLFGGFFDQFKKFKYLGCSLSLVPAARLPADPLQVSYDAGEPTIDPRDLMNPLMFHGCHGNDLGNILNRLYALGSVGATAETGLFAEHLMQSSGALFFDEETDFTGLNTLESLYYKALTDNTWKKAHAQRGFRKNGLRPLVYSLATTHQIANHFDVGAFSPDGAGVMGFDNNGYMESYGEPGLTTVNDEDRDVYAFTRTQTTKGLQFLTPKLTGLGWMDTRNVLAKSVSSSEVDYSGGDVDEIAADAKEAMAGLLAVENRTALPLVYMGVILLPPAYKTEQYFRMIITHHFGFKGFRGISFANDIMDTPCYHDWNSDISSQSAVREDPVVGDWTDSPN